MQKIHKNTQKYPKPTRLLRKDYKYFPDIYTVSNKKRSEN